MSDEPTLVERARKEADELDDELGGTIALLRELADQVDDYDQLFSMQYTADMRGVALWRAANPGNELVLPDQGKLIFWLLQEITRMQADQKLDHQQLFDGTMTRIANVALHERIARFKVELFEAGKLAGKQQLELEQHAAKTTKALQEIEQAHQAIHKRQDNHALHCIARAMEALA